MSLWSERDLPVLKWLAETLRPSGILSTYPLDRPHDGIPPQQLPPVTVDPLLKPGMIQPRRVGPVQETDKRLELLTAIGKPGGRSRNLRRTAVAAKLGCSIAITLPCRQEFNGRRVKCASKGVEIGGHVDHLRGRRRT